MVLIRDFKCINYFEQILYDKYLGVLFKLKYMIPYRHIITCILVFIRNYFASLVMGR